MTGFGRARETVDGLDITVEVRSVNHRYFELNARLPRSYQFLEERLKALCQEYVSRGKIELSVQLVRQEDDAVVVTLNRAYADAYLAALRELAERYGLDDHLPLSALANQGELFTVEKREPDEERVTAAVTAVARQALDAFRAMRAAEGGRLAADVVGRADAILGMVAAIEERSPKTVAEYRARLEQKLRELLAGASVDEQRILTETALFADKIAVAEETVRLRSHIEQLGTLLQAGGAIGRKLDFLVQEMNREANTIGSKAQDLTVTRLVVDVKAEIEKIREQIQNLE